jgi:hypothetical protein
LTVVRRRSIAALAVALFACSPVEVEPAARSVVLISVDTLRADHLGCYGHVRDTSPTLDALAAGGVLFEQAIATSPWTLPSHVSLLTGLYPSRHGVRSVSHALDGTVPTLATLLGARGLRTAAIVNSLLLDERSGLSRGFESFDVVATDQSMRGAARRRRSRSVLSTGSRPRAIGASSCFSTTSMSTATTAPCPATRHSSRRPAATGTARQTN